MLNESEQGDGNVSTNAYLCPIRARGVQYHLDQSSI